MEEINNNKKPLLVYPEEDAMFQKELKPRKAWYKRWWVIAYAVVFVVSVFVLIVFSQVTNQVLENLNSENIGKTSPTAVNQTLAPGAVEQLDKDVVSTDSTLQGADNDPFFGNPTAGIVIVEFGDYECPYCAEAAPLVRQMLTQYPDDIYFVFRDFPIPALHPQALEAAQAAHCAWEQGSNIYWAYHDQLFLNQDSFSTQYFINLAQSVGADNQQFSTCLQTGKYAEAVIRDQQAGVDLGVVGTPTFYVNGYKLSGVVPADYWQQIIELFKLTSEAQ